MGYQPLEELLPRSNHSIYKLVIIASKRASELAEGAPKLIDFPSSSKVTTIALEEIQQGKVMLKPSEGGSKKADSKAKKEEAQEEKAE